MSFPLLPICRGYAVKWCLSLVVLGGCCTVKLLWGSFDYEHCETFDCAQVCVDVIIV